MDSEDEDIISSNILTLYVKAGCDHVKYGACPLSQRIFMVLMLKAARNAQLKFRVATVPPTRLPDEFKHNGLRNLPAIIHTRVAIDTVEEIIDYIELKFPQPNLGMLGKSVKSSSGPRVEDVDKLTRNFFSKFCFYIKSVSKDPAAMESELKRLDEYLQKNESKFIVGDSLCHLDCEILPKLHHLRVACCCLKNYVLPPEWIGIWRYLHNAYNHEVFQKTCPPDQEIVLQWASRPDTPLRLSYAAMSILTRNTPRFSFDVPAVAMPITLR